MRPRVGALPRPESLDAPQTRGKKTGPQKFDGAPRWLYSPGNRGAVKLLRAGDIGRLSRALVRVMQHLVVQCSLFAMLLLHVSSFSFSWPRRGWWQRDTVYCVRCTVHAVMLDALARGVLSVGHQSKLASKCSKVKLLTCIANRASTSW
jgi:hypothetical protein